MSVIVSGEKAVQMKNEQLKEKAKKQPKEKAE